MNNLEVIVLAAGQGKRMHSSLPKVLQPLAGRPLLAHVLAAARALAPRALHVVYGHGGEQVRAAFEDADVRWVLQAEQLGTGHAVAQAMDAVADDATVLILYGDVPLIRPETLEALLAAARPPALGLLTADLPDPTGYGRVLRHPLGQIERIVEHKDATPEEAAINEINTGILTAPAARLRAWLAGLENRNTQGEYYLTDVIAAAVADGVEIVTHQPEAVWEIQGVNSKSELAVLERTCQRNRADALLAQGVTLLDPARLDVRGSLECGRDVVIDVNVVFEGRVVLGEGVHVGPNCLIRDSAIGAGTTVLANSVLESVVVGPECRVGPFARLRPGSRLARGVHVGNFVEVKASELGEGSKVNHLTYVGDASVGREVNIGAGTITCNYDGANKHRTVIGDRAFIGSNTALVAPVTVGADATVGAGSVITRDAPAQELTVARGRQQTVKGWKRPTKEQKS